MSVKFFTCRKCQVENHGISKKLTDKVKELVNKHYEDILKERFYESELAKELGSRSHTELSDVDWESSFFVRHPPNPNINDITNLTEELWLVSDIKANVYGQKVKG